MAKEKFTDMIFKGWVERVPDPVRPYIYLARLDRPVGVWLLLLPGLWAIVMAAGGVPGMDSYTWGLLFLFTIGAFVMRGAGCVINDLWDRQLDQKVERTAQRPLASGAISPTHAMIFLGALLLIGLLILMQMYITTILLGFLVMPLIIAYPLMKRITWWPQVFLGLTFNFSALMGWSAVTGIVDMPAVILYIGCILWTVGYDTVYAHQDMEDDLLVGIKSTALKFGKYSKLFVMIFYGAAWLFFAAAGSMAFPNGYVIFFLLPAAMFMAHCLTEWDPDSQKSSLHVFKANRNFGILILAAFALYPVVF